MKFSLLSLFLILLILLVLSVLFCRWAQNNTEGFITFQYDKESLNQVTIPMYSDSSNKLYKIHDNMFFDNKNGNLVEVEGPGESTDGSDIVPDNTGADISKLHIIPRVGNGVLTYYIDSINNRIEPPETDMSNSYNSKIYKTKGTTTDTYTVFSMPWYDNTYVHVMKTPTNMNGSISAEQIAANDAQSAADQAQIAADASPSDSTLADAAAVAAESAAAAQTIADDAGDNNTTYTSTEHLSTTAFTNNATAINFMFQPGNNMSEVTESKNDSDSNNNKMVLEPLYNSERQVYQISEFVKFDISNANLLVSSGQDSDKKVNVYNRNGNTSMSLSVADANTNEPTTHGDGDSINNSTFTSRTIPDISGQNMILYVPNAKKTLVALIHYDNNEELSLRNVCRFTPSGIDTGDTDMGEGAEINEDTDDENEYDANYGGRYRNERERNRNERERNRNNSSNEIDMDNYMLKSQIVPPVCPACPSCNYNTGGACGKCGGNGGGGTCDSNGKSLVKTDKICKRKNDKESDSDCDCESDGDSDRKKDEKKKDEKKKPIKNAIKSTGDIASGAVNTVGGVAGGAIGTAGDVTGGLVGTAGDVTGELVGTAGDVADGVVKTFGNVLGGIFPNNNGNGNGNGNNNGNSMNQGQVQGQLEVQNQGQVQGQGQGQGQNQGQGLPDAYSYNGKLAQRGSNEFMPRTSDFSSFGR